MKTCLTSIRLILSAWLCLAATSAAWAQDIQDEYRVKAAYIYNFTKFIEWPDSVFATADAPFSLCILGTNPFGSYLDSLEGRLVRGRKITVSQLQNPAALIHADCHALYISASEQSHLGVITEHAIKHHMLSLSDIPGFVQQGGVIRFITLNNKIRFSINPETARRSNLKIASQLMRLAILPDDHE